jgi:hypothetical protein
MTVVYTLNWSLTSSVKGRTPYEALHDKKPSVHHLWVFGCTAYMMITWPHLAKLDYRGLKTIIIGYEPESKAYRLFNPVDGRLHVSCDVIVDENTFWSWDDNNMEEHGGEPFMVEYLITEPGEEGAHDHVTASPALSGGASPAVSTNPPAPPSIPAPFQASPPAQTPSLVPQPVEFMLPRTTAKDHRLQPWHW